MTQIPEGRQPLEWADLKGYPSDALTEAKQLRARVQELEAALTRIKNYTGHPTATTQTS